MYPSFLCVAVLGGSQDVEMVPAIDQLAVFQVSHTVASRVCAAPYWPRPALTSFAAQGAMSSGGFGGESQPMPHHRSRVLPPFVKLVSRTPALHVPLGR